MYYIISLFVDMVSKTTKMKCVLPILLWITIFGEYFNTLEPLCFKLNKCRVILYNFLNQEIFNFKYKVFHFIVEYS